MEYIALDVHKRYTWARVETVHGERVIELRVLHQRGAIQNFVRQWAPGLPVAVETVGNWYWVVAEVEAGGGQPQLVNARLAKLMMGSVNKSDRLDVQGLPRLQQTGTLPTVWIPPGAVRDARELPRTRLVFRQPRTQLKNRVLATFAKYGLMVEGVSDALGAGGRQRMAGPGAPVAAADTTGGDVSVESTGSGDGHPDLSGTPDAGGVCPASPDGLAQDAAEGGRSPGDCDLDLDRHRRALSPG